MSRGSDRFLYNMLSRGSDSRFMNNSVSVFFYFYSVVVVYSSYNRFVYYSVSVFFDFYSVSVSVGVS